MGCPNLRVLRPKWIRPRRLRQAEIINPLRGLGVLNSLDLTII